MEHSDLLNQLLLGLKSNFPDLSLQKATELLQYAEVKVVKKREDLIKRGLYCGKIFFVINGLFKAYYEKNDMENTFWFREENTVFASHKSIIANQPSEINYKALEDSMVASMDYTLLKELAKEDFEVAQSINTVLEGLILELILRIEEFTTLNSEDRYASFLERYSHISNRISQQDIASYIGLTPASFSRLKSQLQKK